MKQKRDKLRLQNKKLSNDFKQLAIRSKDKLATYETYCREAPFCSRKALQSVNTASIARDESKKFLSG